FMVVVLSVLRTLLSFPSTTRRPPTSTLFPYTTLFRSRPEQVHLPERRCDRVDHAAVLPLLGIKRREGAEARGHVVHRARQIGARSEEHTSELQSPDHLVCRLLLEKKKKKQKERTLQTD